MSARHSLVSKIEQSQAETGQDDSTAKAEPVWDRHEKEIVISTHKLSQLRNVRSLLECLSSVSTQDWEQH